MEKKHSTEWSCDELGLVRGYASTVALNAPLHKIPQHLCNGCVAVEVLVACIQELRDHHSVKYEHLDILVREIFEKEQKEESVTGTGTR